MTILRVLIVEDSVHDTELLLRDLRRTGYVVTHERVDTRTAMLNALEKSEWDIVISDYQMPHFNALEALAILKDSERDLPFLVVSGAIGEETAVEAMRAGAHDYLMKGKLQRLLPAIERELREAKIRAQRAETELALYASEEKFRFMFEHTPVPMWVVEATSLGFLEVNEAAVAGYGYSRKEFLQMTLPQLQAPDSQMQPLLSSAHRTIGETKHKLKNGNVIEVEIHSDALELNGKNVVVFISQDITQHKQTERELIRARETALEAYRLKSEFLTNVSHEIRTPLNGIIGMTGLLLKSALPNKEKEWAEIIRSSGDALLSIVNQVHDFSRAESGKIEFEKLDFNLMDLIRKTSAIFSYAAKNKKIQLVVHPPSDRPLHVHGDPERLRQVLMNLLDNALKFTHQGEVRVLVDKLSEDDDNIMLKISVRDTGIGIPSQAHARLFRPFSQADSSTTRKYGGTGLGLAICEKIITMMGGEIGFESEWDHGSTFWFKMNFKKYQNPTETPARNMAPSDKIGYKSQKN